jgi:O-antigen/teichoic acid export membrane protein
MTVAEVGVQDIKRMALRGGMAKLVSQAGNFALRLGFMIAAARLLDPADFGIVAMVTVVTAVLDLFATAGLSSAAVQRSSIDNAQISTLFWINLLVGIALFAFCVLIAPLVVAFYHEPRLLPVMAVMGIGFVLNAAGVQQLALLQRQMRYVSLAGIEFSSQLASLALGLCLALAGYGYWALVIAAIALPAFVTLSSWMATGWIPGRPVWNAGIGSMLHFGGTVTVNGVISYMTYSFDKFVVGRVFGASSLGYYGVAAQLINTPTSNLNMALGGVTFSALSRLQNDPARFRSYFLKGYALNVSLTLPITIFCAVFAHDIILVVLGPKWQEAADIFQFLAPTALFFGIINPMGWLLWASHRHVRSLQLAIVIAALVVTGCLLGLPYGPKGVAAGFSTVMMLWFIPHIVWCLHGTAVAPLDLLRASARPLFAALIAVLLAYAARTYWDPFQMPLARLALDAGVMVSVYSSFMIFIMGKDFYLDLFKAMRSAPSASAESEAPAGAGASVAVARLDGAGARPVVMAET